MKRTAILLFVAVLAAACADTPEAPPSLADQLSEQIGDAADRPSETLGEEPDDPQVADPAPTAEDGEGAAPEDVEEATFRQAIADADARCAEIYARGDALALEYLADLDPDHSAEGISTHLEAALEHARSLTEEVVVSLEQAARDDARLEPVAATARVEMLPVFTEMIDLLATADDDELDAFAMQAWPRLSGFVADLASLGFRHCFQEQALIP